MLVREGSMRNAMSKAIGGYFELELPVAVYPLYQHSIRFQSARAAFHALLNVGRPQRVWMPKYICDAMLAPLHALGIEIVFYDLDQRLSVAESVTLSPEDWLLYVNYFGLCCKQEAQLLKRFNPSQLIMDHSQALFAVPQKCLATIYSPRKFFGLPDGGLLHTTLNISESEQIDSSSVSRCIHLLQRLNTTAESGYADFKLAEETLNDIQPRRMSGLSEKLLACIDLETIKQRRNKNFHFLHRELQHLNGFEVDLTKIDGPLCYPLLINDHGLRKRLISERIFISTYWPEVMTRVKPESIEYSMTSKCLPLPCDQRYNPSDLIRMVHLVVP